MRIVSLSLENFQGIKSFRMDLDGKSASVYGDNATGKTTVYNAFTWLMFGRSSTNTKGFTPKTRTAEGEAHNLEHAVEAQVMTEDFNIVRLRKVFREVWKRQRGSAETEFSGHTTEFYVDGVPVKEKEYTARVEAMCGGDAERAKLLSMPDYFSEWLGWEDRRKVLLSICGDVTDGEIISSDSALSDLPQVLLKPGSSGARYTIDEYRGIADAKKREINRQLAEIPSRIDEQNRIAVQTVEMTKDEIKAEIDDTEKRCREAEIERNMMQSGSTADAEIRSEIARLKADLVEKKAAYVKKKRESEAEEDDRRAAVEKDIRKVIGDIFDLEVQIGKKKREKEDLEERREEIIREIQKIRAEEWVDASPVCPTCGQPLPVDQVQAKKEAFLQDKSRRLEDLTKKGKDTASREKIAVIEIELSSLFTQIEQKKADREALENGIKTLQNAKKAWPVFEETREGIEAQMALNEAEERLESGHATVDEAVDRLNRKIAEYGARLSKLRSDLSAIEMASRRANRIAELEAYEKDLAAEYEKLERGLWLCGRFIKRKVQMLDAKINERFIGVKFRLFREQINGGIVDDCEVLIPSPDGNMVPYSTANHAARINAGLEIIDTLSEFFKVSMPVWVDNAEAITRLKHTSGQVIRLVVSAEDPVLRLVLDGAENQ